MTHPDQRSPNSAHMVTTANSSLMQMMMSLFMVAPVDAHRSIKAGAYPLARANVQVRSVNSTIDSTPPVSRPLASEPNYLTGTRTLLVNETFMTMKHFCKTA